MPGQGVIYDGISSYKICPEDFDVKFSTGVKGRFIPPPEPEKKARHPHLPIANMVHPCPHRRVLAPGCRAVVSASPLAPSRRSPCGLP